MDANAKLGCDIINQYPNKISNNGRLLIDIIQRQNLIILNSHDLCQGTITQNRKTVSGEELSVIDYILVCDFLADYLAKMEIEESRIHSLL